MRIDIEAVGQLSELERRMSLILIQRETFPLLETQIKPGVFDVHEGTTSDLRRGWSVPRVDGCQKAVCEVNPVLLGAQNGRREAHSDLSAPKGC